MGVTRDTIVNILRQVQDPKLGRDIVSSGMVKEIRVEGGSVYVRLEIAFPENDLREKVRAEANERLASCGGVREVRIDVTVPQRYGVTLSKVLPIAGVDHILAVASGKGGVGKTTVAVNLACALQGLGYRVGLMDGDIYGPNVPLMMGLDSDTQPGVTPDKKMIPVERFGVKIISMGLLASPDQAIVWRGPMLHKAVTQFLQQVKWGSLDYLFVDLPPGTGDVQISLVQTVPVSSALIVRLPQEVSLLDARKAAAMFRTTGVSILGIVENMTGEIFGWGGGRKTAAELGVPYLGQIPLQTSVRECGDLGNPIVVAMPDHPAARGFVQTAKSLTEILSRVRT
ncbi:MAG: Mrp/NBP35 family ATP-binding protein [Candidatus Omnitrophica bacterium]|nr:Mrp/NBP35 family ATP-binding protein [Candidatus Omnitrophota bacterium]